MTEPRRVRLPGGVTQIHLTGFMASGKSTVGKLLARRLLWNFLDLDGVIERHEERSVATIFEESGEAAFRRSEAHVLRQVVLKPSTVVALGGGTRIDPENCRVSDEHAAVVWLRCPLGTLEARCADESGGRPLWGDGAQLEQRYAERVSGYESAAFRVDADASPDDVAAVVLEVLGVADQ